MKKASKEDAKKLGSSIDALYEFDQKIHAIERRLKKVKERRAREELRLLRAMQDIKLEKGSGRRANAAITKRRIPTIKNQVQFQKFVKKHDAFDLYQNRIASRAYFARLEEKQSVPGVEIFEKVSVSIRKRG